MAGLTNNPIELLITLGVNSNASLLNINNSIAALKTKVGKLDIEINPIIKNGNFTKGIITDLDGVQKKAKETDTILGGIGGRSNNTPKIFAGYKDAVIDTLTNLDQLKKYLNKNEFKFDIKMGIDKNGEAYVKKVIADVKNAKGQIETIHIKPVLDQNGVVRFEQFSKGLKDVSTFKLQEEIVKANKVLDDFEKRGKLAAIEYSKFRSQLEKPPNIQAINKIIDELKIKESSAIFGDKIGESLHKAALKADELKNKLERLEQTKGSNAPAKRIAELRKEIEQILKLPINTINDSKIVAGKLSEVEKKIGFASISAADSKVFETTLRKARDEVEKLQKIGLLTDDSIRKLYARLANVPHGNIAQMTNEFNKLQGSVKYFSERKLVLNGIEQNANNVRTLNSQLERTVNLNRKYIDSSSYNKLISEIQVMSKAQITNRKEVEASVKKYQDLKLKVQEFSAAATQASRNSMTVLNAFKVAMERFPMENIQVGTKLS